MRLGDRLTFIRLEEFRGGLYLVWRSFVIDFNFRVGIRYMVLTVWNISNCLYISEEIVLGIMFKFLSCIYILYYLNFRK